MDGEWTYVRTRAAIRGSRSTDNSYSARKAFKDLVAHGSPVRAANNDGITPLHVATDREEFVDLLLEKGALVDAAAADGQTPFLALKVRVIK